MEYGNIVKESVTPKSNNVIFDEVWNVYNSQKVPEKKLNKKVETIQGGESQMTKIIIISWKAGRRAK